MEKPGSHPPAAAHRQATPPTKRTADGEPKTATETKRIKASRDGVPDSGSKRVDAVLPDRGRKPLVRATDPPGSTRHDITATSEHHQPRKPKRRVPFPDKPAVLEELNGEIEFRVVNNDGRRESAVILTGLKNLFQKQLPVMPKVYIARLVYDRTHISLAMIRLETLQVIGGITIREFPNHGFAEIVFCAVSSDQQVKGYGTHLMAHLKDYVKATSNVMHFLTYADNFATGYFQKQGFTKDITLPKAKWMGYIKDYEGANLMQCTMVPRVRYLEVGRMLLKQKETVQAKIRTLSRSHIVHKPPQQWANGVKAFNPLDIPAIKATGWSPAMDALAREPRRGAAFNRMRMFLYQMQNHKDAWPFLKPVDKDEVPDYYTVITHPMDLTTMDDKLEKDEYSNPKEMVADCRLMFKNCKKYNDKTTVYPKVADKLEKYMWSLVEDISEWYEVLDERDDGK